MKFDALQSDFSAGELSPKAQGQVGSDIYRAALKRMANMAPTRTGSAASRAGGRLISDGYNDGSLGPGHNQGLVQHVPIQDGPFADFIVEIGPKYLRLMDKFGVIPWIDMAQQFLNYKYKYFDAFSKAWADYDTRVVHLYHKGAAPGAALYPLVAAVGGGNPNAYPAGTDESWVLTGRIAGSTTRIVVNPTGGPLQTFDVSPSTDGRFSVAFVPTVAGVAVSFAIDLYTLPDGQENAATLWDLHLVKNANPTVVAHNLLLATDSFEVDRIRAAACWVNMNLRGFNAAETPNFWVAFAGGVRGVFSGYSLRWQPSAAGLPSKWTWQALPQPPNSQSLTGCSTVAVYQDRIWFGRNVSGQRPQLIASKIGFVDLFDSQLFPGGTPGAASAQVLFVFKVVAETYVVTGGFVDQHEDVNIAVTGGTADVVRFNIPVTVPPYPDNLYTLSHVVDTARLAVYRNGVPIKVVPGPVTNLVPAAGECVGQAPQFYWSGSQDGVGGNTWWKHPYLAVGDVLTFTTIPLATDPLNLTMSSAAKIAWLNVLRGLMMGTTQSEKLFSQGQALTLDPATGLAFSLNDESWLGADERIMALNVNDKVLYVQRGRKILRLANISITNNGGLVSEDVGVLGEHLTAPRVRAMCFLKTPVQRVIFALDDGTGAVMTLGGKAGVAWSRFTLPAAFGGIYSVAAMHAPLGSELWVGTDNGVSLQWDSFESDIQQSVLTTPAVFPGAPVRTPYDTFNPAPPVMDGWARCGLATDGVTQWISGLSRTCLGQNIYCLVNGQVMGPYIAVADPSGDWAKVIFPAGNGLAAVWVDPAGVRQAQEVYAGLAFPEHKIVTLPLEGGNPAGTSQAYKARRVQCYVRLVDSYAPVVGLRRVEERGPTDTTDVVGGRITGDRRVTQLSFERGETLEISQDLPLRMEISAILGGTMVESE